MSQPQYLNFVEGEDVIPVVSMETPPPGGVADWTMLFTLRDASGVVLTASSGAGIALVDAAAGVWTVTFKVPRLASGLTTVYRWDMWRTDLGGEFSAAHGGMTVLPRARA